MICYPLAHIFAAAIALIK